jgi:hypothetical protein
LLKLNLVDGDRWERLVEVALDGYVALLGVLLNNSDNFTNYVWDVDIFLVEGLLLEESSNMLHCLVSRAGIPTYTGAFGSSNVPGSEMPMRITASFSSSTPAYCFFHSGICSTR